MHIEKYKLHQISAITRHIFRDNDNYSNKNIDKERTKENYNFCFGKDIRGLEYINERTKDIEITPNHKKDAVRLVGLCITLPEELKQYDKDIQADFFLSAANAVCQRYGTDKIGYAAVHRDETNPHLHIGIIPIVRDKDGKEKLCAKEMFNREELKKLHPEIEKATKENMKHKVEFSLKNGKTHTKDVRELKTKDIEAFKKDLSRLRKENEELRKENTELRKELERTYYEKEDFER